MQVLRQLSLMHHYFFGYTTSNQIIFILTILQLSREEEKRGIKAVQIMYWVSAPIVQPWEDTMDFCVYKPWLLHGSCFHSRICFVICLLVSFKLLLSSLQYAYNF